MKTITQQYLARKREREQIRTAAIQRSDKRIIVAMVSGAALGMLSAIGLAIAICGGISQ